jgi:murein L,D-transpeptidase YafK
MQEPTLEIIIHKQARTLLLCDGARVAGTYPVALGRNWAADKELEGDEATPVGEFYICAKNPRSKFFLSMCISYPNVEDAERGLAARLITGAEHAQILAAIGRRATPPQHTRLGGEIYIHGHALEPDGRSPAGVGDPADAEVNDRLKDWTRGCIALRNHAMRALYERVTVGTPVLITGADPTRTRRCPATPH